MTTCLQTNSRPIRPLIKGKQVLAVRQYMPHTPLTRPDSMAAESQVNNVVIFLQQINLMKSLWTFCEHNSGP